MKNLKYTFLLLLLSIGGIQINAQNFVCRGEQVCLVLDEDRGTIQWQWSNDGTTFTDIAGANDDSLCTNVDMDGFYRAMIADGTCDIVYSDTTEFTVNDLAVDAGADTTICEFDGVELASAAPASGGTPPYTYSWAPAAGLSDPALPNPMASPTADTDYILSVTDGNNCTWTDTVTITVTPIPTGVDTFFFTGAPELFVMPNCVDTLHYELWGAGGADGSGPNGGNGGLGGYVSNAQFVQPGDTIYVVVGGTNGYNGGGSGGTSPAQSGGNGGGASDLRFGSTDPGDRVPVAGGGGGGGSTGDASIGPCSNGGNGGNGGAATGQAGAFGAAGCATAQAGGGTGGSNAAVGVGGVGGSNCGVTGNPGTNGNFTGDGGPGGDGVNGVCPEFGGGGGGGGGGWRGGGGGAGGSGGGAGAGGGGGGANRNAGAYPGDSQQGVNAGEGMVILRW